MIRLFERTKEESLDKMLKRYAVFFSTLQSVFDISLIAVAWIGTYFIRFYSKLFSSPKGIPAFEEHIYLTLLVVFLCYLACSWSGLYRPKRLQSFFNQIALAFKACVISAVLVSTALYYLYNEPYSRKLLVIFLGVLFTSLVLSRVVTMAILRKLRRKGYNLRYYAVIGAGKKGQRLVRDMEELGWIGMKCKFFVDNDPARIDHTLLGVPVYGPVERTMALVDENEIDEIYLTLSGSEAVASYPVLGELQNQGITVRTIPDWGNLLSTNVTVVPIGSQVLFSAGESALQGSGIIIKEAFDWLAALLLLLVFAVPMALIAILVKLTANGPVFYKQTRVGMDQKEFKMLKFRTMRVDAEKEDTPQWSKPGDPRRTSIGVWLRRTSLDEIPQLINVVKGQMSLVGPRPERPQFVKQFSEEYKKYMLRHKVKAGMTGLAQINGFRGDTSLKKRLQYDLYYIRNWSFAMDMWILLRTPWHIIKGKNAH